MNKIIISLFLSGLFFGSGPCLASCGPVLLTYIAGTKRNTLGGFIVYSLFSLSRIFIYIILGLTVFFLGRVTLDRLIGDYSKYIYLLGGGFIILVGLLMALGRRLELKFCQAFQKNILERDKKSIIILGLVMGLSPCAPLLAVLSYIGLVSKSWVTSLIYSLTFGLGTFVSPLIALSMFAGLIPRFLPDKRGYFYQIFSFICGLMIIFFGIQIARRAF